MSNATLVHDMENEDGDRMQTWEGMRYSRDWAGIGLCIPLIPNRNSEPASASKVVLEFLAGLRVWRTADATYTRVVPQGLQTWLFGLGDDTIHDASLSYDVGPYFEFRFLFPDPIRK